MLRTKKQFLCTNARRYVHLISPYKFGLSQAPEVIDMLLLDILGRAHLRLHQGRHKRAAAVCARVAAWMTDRKVSRERYTDAKNKVLLGLQWLKYHRGEE